MVIRCDTEVGLGAAEADPETGHHLDEHQECAVFLREFPQTFEETGFRLDEAGVTDDRLENDTCDGVWVLGEQGFDRLQIVVGSGQRVGGRAARHPRGIGEAESCHAGTGLDQEHVRMAVIAA